MLLVLDGFDKYGAANTNSTVVAGLLTAGEWTSATGGTTYNIVAGLSATGFALVMSATAGSLTKTLPSNYGRLIGGIRFSSTLAAIVGIQLQDAGTNQCGIAINTTGTVSVKNGIISSGTVLGTSASAISANTTHYLEWDITLGNAASYQIWMDGVSILSGSGDTTATANNTANGFSLTQFTSGVWTIDDLYIFDTSGTTNNVVLLTSPRIETQFPSGDGVVQFAVGAATLGSSVSRSSSAVSNSANQWRTRQFTPSRNCTLNSISFLPIVTLGSVNLRPIIYSDSASAPATLITSGATVVGMTANVPVTMPLTTPQALAAGTPYWLGFMSDVVTGGGSLGSFDGTSADRIGVVTFASGAPASPPSLSNAITVVMWGNITGTGVNYYETNQNPTQGVQSYLYDTQVGHEDLYTYPALTAPPAVIYGVAIKSSVAKSDAGAKTCSLRLKSSATDSAGTGGTALAPGTSFAWMTSLFERDPNGNITWTKTAVDAAQAGVKVES